MTVKRGDPSESDLPAKLSQPAQRALAGAGIRNLKDLTKFSETANKKMHGIGPNAMKQLHEALATRGLSYVVEKKNKA